MREIDRNIKRIPLEKNTHEHTYNKREGNFRGKRIHERYSMVNLHSNQRACKRQMYEKLENKCRARKFMC